LLAAVPGLGGPPWPIAREGPMAANAIIAAVAKNNRQNRRWRRHGVNVPLGFVMLELPRDVF
jgi:hypothetical protein